jgi:hypothetical protein
MKVVEQRVSPDWDVVVRQICTALAASSKTGGAKIIPSILISRPTALESWKSLGSSAEWAIAWYRRFGFAADRTRMNLYGYPGILRQLMYGECDNDDDDDLETHPLYANLLKEAGIDLPLDPPNVVQAIKELREESERERHALSDALGPDGLDALTHAIFDFDEFPPFAPGTPDILVWLHTPATSCWFLSEVKAPSDSLRESQKDWLAARWGFVCGHYLLTILE